MKAVGWTWSPVSRKLLAALYLGGVACSRSSSLPPALLSYSAGTGERTVDRSVTFSLFFSLLHSGFLPSAAALSIEKHSKRGLSL